MEFLKCKAVIALVVMVLGVSYIPIFDTFKKKYRIRPYKT